MKQDEERERVCVFIANDGSSRRLMMGPGHHSKASNVPISNSEQVNVFLMNIFHIGSFVIFRRGETRQPSFSLPVSKDRIFIYF